MHGCQYCKFSFSKGRSLKFTNSTFTVPQLGVMTGVELALERMSTAKGGKGGLVVNTASLAGLVTDDPFVRWSMPNKTQADMILGSYPYFVSKCGVVALTRSLGVSSAIVV